ncbi:uncharacterized protein LOC142338386 [Convolutriloba macropyga]|uniref:uncharacterized protein LOC142338386 n=1 Tax=Convolutriloba macropyga TaxID=536237 RepID=UPI003F528CB5
MVSTTDIPNSQSGITQKLKMSRAANHSGVSKLMFGFCVLVAVTIFVQETTALTIAVPETEQDALLYSEDSSDPTSYDKRSSAMHFFKRESPLTEEELLKRSSPWHYGKRSSPWHYGKRSSPWHYGKRSSAMHFFKRDSNGYPYLDESSSEGFYA